MNKKFAILVLALGFGTLSFAQLNYGFKVGVTQSKIKENFANENQVMNFESGFQGGAFIDYNLLNNLHLRPALQLTQKGYEAVEGNENGQYYWYRKWSLTYLEIPVEFIYNLPLSQATKLYVGTGPLLSLGLFGKGKAIYKDADYAGQSYTRDIAVNKPFTINYKAFDLGAVFTVGLEHKRILLNTSYNHGVLNTLVTNDITQKVRNKCFAFTVGYLLNKNRL